MGKSRKTSNDHGWMCNPIILEVFHGCIKSHCIGIICDVFQLRTFCFSWTSLAAHDIVDSNVGQLNITFLFIGLYYFTKNNVNYFRKGMVSYINRVWLKYHLLKILQVIIPFIFFSLFPPYPQ